MQPTANSKRTLPVQSKANPKQAFPLQPAAKPKQAISVQHTGNNRLDILETVKRWPIRFVL